MGIRKLSMTTRNIWLVRGSDQRFISFYLSYSHLPPDFQLKWLVCTISVQYLWNWISAKNHHFCKCISNICGRHKHPSCLISHHSHQIESFWQLLKSIETEIACTGKCVIHILRTSQTKKLPEWAQDSFHQNEASWICPKREYWKQPHAHFDKMFHLVIWQQENAQCGIYLLPALLTFLSNKCLHLYSWKKYKLMLLFQVILSLQNRC